MGLSGERSWWRIQKEGPSIATVTVVNAIHLQERILQICTRGNENQCERDVVMQPTTHMYLETTLRVFFTGVYMSQGDVSLPLSSCFERLNLFKPIPLK